MQPESTWIEKLAQGIGLIPDLSETKTSETVMLEPGPLSDYPPPKGGMTGRNMKLRDGLKKKRSVIRLSLHPVLIVSQDVVF